MTHFLKYLFVPFVMVLALSSCAVYPPEKQQTTDLTAAGFLSLFMNQSATETQLHVTISNIEIFAEPIWYPLDAAVSSETQTNPQQLLATAALSANRYTRIHFQLTITDSDGQLLRKEQTELPLSRPLIIKAGSSHCLFIDNQLTIQNLDQPLSQQLPLTAQQRPLVDEILYILCPDIQTLYVAKSSPLRIVAAYGVGEDIADMALDNRRKILYLLDRRYRMIKKFDTISQSLTDRISLPLTDQPDSLGLNSDGNFVYVSDPSNLKVLQLDSRNGNLRQQQTTTYPPGRIHPFSFQQQHYLAILYPQNQQLQVVSAETMKPLYSVNAGLQPEDVVFSDSHLFISDSFSRQILKINPLTGNVLTRITTPYAPGELVNDPVNRNLLTGFCRQQEIAFLPFGQQLIARRIKVDGCPADMVISNRRRLLFTALGTQQKVKVFDLPSEKLLGTLNLPAQPEKIAFQEP